MQTYIYIERDIYETCVSIYVCIVITVLTMYHEQEINFEKRLKVTKMMSLQGPEKNRSSHLQEYIVAGVGAQV